MPSGLAAAVELRLGKIRAGQAQNLLGLAQLPVLSLQGLDALTFFAGRAWALAGVGLMAANPAIQGLRGTTDLRRYGLNGHSVG